MSKKPKRKAKAAIPETAGTDTNVGVTYFIAIQCAKAISDVKVYRWEVKRKWET